MKRKGFTLVEIIVVIALIAIVSTIIIVNMTGVQQNTNEVEIKRFKDKISSAACQYVDKGTNLVLSTDKNCSTDARLTSRDDCKENPDGCFVCLSTLIEEGLIDQESVDPNTNKKLKEENTAVRVRVKWVKDGDTKKKVCEFEGEDEKNTTPSINVQARKRKVYFNYTEGSGTETSREVEEGKSIGSLPEGVRDGYMIDYWYYYGDESKHASSSDKMGSNDISLVAHWTVAKYTLTINNNDGSAPRQVTQNSGTTYTPIASSRGSQVLTGSDYTTTTSYTFNGWSHSGGGSWDGSKFTFTGNGTLTANWKTSTVTQYNLYINANGGSYSGGTTIKQNANTTYTPSTPYRSGYRFTGWSKSGGGSWNGSTFTFTGSGTLTANWQQNVSCTYSHYSSNKYWLGTYTCNGSTGTLTSCSNRVKGYTCNGGSYGYANTYMCTASSSTKYNDYQTCSTSFSSSYKNYGGGMSSTESCSCQNVTINFNLNGGSGSTPGSLTFVYGTAIGKDKLPKTITYGITHPTLVFDGWWTSPSGGTKLYYYTQMTSNQTYYAHWRKAQLTYDYTVFDGDSAIDSKCYGKVIEKNKGEKWGTLCTPSSVSGYTRKYWYTDYNLDGTVITASRIKSTTKVTDDVYVYAVYKKKATSDELLDDGGDVLIEDSGTTWTCTSGTRSRNSSDSDILCNGSSLSRTEYYKADYTCNNNGCTRSTCYKKVDGYECRYDDEIFSSSFGQYRPVWRDGDWFDISCSDAYDLPASTSGGCP